MGDDVVQFAGDPGALGGRGDLGLRVPFAFQPGRAVLQRGVVPAPVAHGVTEDPGDQRRARERDQAHRDPVGQAHARGLPPGHRGGRSDQADGQAGHGYPAPAVRGQGVQQDQDGRVDRGDIDVEQYLETAHGNRDGEGGHRVVAAEHQRDGQGQRDRDQPVVARGEGRHQGGDPQDGGEHAVHQPGMTAQPEVEGAHGSSVRAALCAGRHPAGGTRVSLAGEAPGWAGPVRGTGPAGLAFPPCPPCPGRARDTGLPESPRRVPG